MGSSSSRKARRRKGRQPFLEKGLSALLLGAGLWLLPLLMSERLLLGNMGQFVGKELLAG